MLPEDEVFMEIIENTPLVSIDLVVLDKRGWVLVGKRTNCPAQGWWFVPGGRILKNERRQDAFQRICRMELGLDADFKETKFRGVYEHIYEDNRFGIQRVGTHYVVLAYEYQLHDDVEIKLDNQHSRVKWLSVKELLEDPEVHPYTKGYFR